MEQTAVAKPYPKIDITSGQAYLMHWNEQAKWFRGSNLTCNVLRDTSNIHSQGHNILQTVVTVVHRDPSLINTVQLC